MVKCASNSRHLEHTFFLVSFEEPFVFLLTENTMLALYFRLYLAPIFLHFPSAENAPNLGQSVQKNKPNYNDDRGHCEAPFPARIRDFKSILICVSSSSTYSNHSKNRTTYVMSLRPSDFHFIKSAGKKMSFTNHIITFFVETKNILRGLYCFCTQNTQFCG